MSPQRLLLRFKTRLLVLLLLVFRCTGRQPLLLADLEATKDFALSKLFMVLVNTCSVGKKLRSPPSWLATSSVLDGGELGYRRFIRCRRT